MLVLDVKIDSGETAWFRVRLNRNTDVMLKSLHTPEELENYATERVKKFLSFQLELFQEKVLDV